MKKLSFAFFFLSFPSSSLGLISPYFHPVNLSTWKLVNTPKAKKRKERYEGKKRVKEETQLPKPICQGLSHCSILVFISWSFYSTPSYHQLIPDR